MAEDIMSHKNKKCIIGKLDCFSNGIMISSETGIDYFKDDLIRNIPEIYNLNGKLVKVTIEGI